ncbi:Lrp/AsnC family transcriptional regulator [Undibacterium sp. Di26W]|uniref:Lrp/AsnC family transcriptional regulator n=1 Tax=Undibacterium sp. Di26W TaxID=3413035 RepID=UPI003BEFBDDA
MDFDHFDLALLDALQRDCRVPAEILGSRIGLSATAVQRRIRRLREDGAIAAEVAVLGPVDPSLVTVIVDVALKQGGTAAIDCFRRATQARTEVQQCWYVTGEYDFVLVVLARGIAEFERFTREVLDANVARFRSTVVLDEVKRSLRIPLRRDPPV